MMQLNIGSGPRDFGNEWDHIDGGNFKHLYSRDVFLKSFPDRCADIIYSSHLIQYFDREEIKELLDHWHRVLKPGGELCIAVPDFEAINKLYSDKEYELEQFLGLLYGKMKMNDTDIYHKTAYDFKSICRVLAAAGFIGVTDIKRVMVETNCGWGHWSISLPDDHSKAVLPHMSHHGTSVSLNVTCFKKL